MPANIHHGETVNAEPVILPIVAAEAVIRNAVAVVTAALLPGTVIRPPVICAITLPSDLLLALLIRVPLLCRPVVVLLTLLILLRSGLLLLLFRGVVLLLALLILLPPSLWLVLSFRLVLLILA